VDTAARGCSRDNDGLRGWPVPMVTEYLAHASNVARPVDTGPEPMMPTVGSEGILIMSSAMINALP
jgi:hypothetical protein